VVVDVTSIVAALPDAIEAFFYPSGANAAERAVVREQHRKFLQEYHMHEGHAPPLLELDTAKRIPFRLASDPSASDAADTADTDDDAAAATT